MLRTVLSFALLCAFLPVAGAPAAPSEKYTAAEKAALAGAGAALSVKAVEGRIKVYDAALARLAQEVRERFREGDDALAAALGNVASLLDESLADIDAVDAALDAAGGAGRGALGRSRRFIRYEISLRRTLKEFHGLRAKVPEGSLDAFQRLLEQMERTRQRFMDILFQQGR
ncbi:MAG: hypothetical protein LBT74_11405 [Acidobacteriota bacterium]|jgi:hypothetical protein|nr:hypothetical protein [Acidobacteriota bacterium]